MTIKVVHFELVTDLTSRAFLATLKRFVSGRGRRHYLNSDNPRNLIGSNNKLNELRKCLNGHSVEIVSISVCQEISWHFTPA